MTTLKLGLCNLRDPLADSNDEEEQEDSDEEEIKVPPDPAHLERMRLLRQENQRLLAVSTQYDAARERMPAITTELKRRIEEKESEVAEWPAVKAARMDSRDDRNQEPDRDGVARG